MSENEVKKAFNAIEPEDGAQERMYANILKKAAAQRAAALEGNVDAPAAEGNATSKTVPLPARRPTPRWKRYSAMAACLALVTTLTIGFLHPFFAGDSEGNEPPVLGGSPFEDVQSAADLEENEYFVADLIGLNAKTDEGEDLGTLTDVLTTGANDVYVIKGADGEELLVPAIHDCVQEVNVEEGYVVLHLLPGLRELNK